jgi:hypothetical protein
MAIGDELGASNKRVYGFVGRGLVALDQQTGRPIWANPQVYSTRRRLAVSRNHLVVAGWVKGAPSAGIVLLNARDGSVAGFTPLSGDESQSVAVSRGMVFTRRIVDLRSGVEGITALGPAERTFRMAVDSDRTGIYSSEKEEDEPKDTALGDAGAIHLRWDAPLAENLRLVRERRKALGKRPLYVALEWADERRSRRFSPAKDEGWSPAEIAAFASACAAIAGAAQPDYFQIAGDLNVYLLRRPEQSESVVALLRAAAAGIHGASPDTKVTASFNVEVIQGVYGLGKARPFGEPAAVKEPFDPTPIVSLLDAVSLTSRPESAYTSPFDLPAEHFLSVAAALRERFKDRELPILVTDLDTEPDAGYLRILLQRAYWLDSPLVVGAPLVGAAATAKNPAWEQVLAWEHVDGLTLRKEWPAEKR